MALGPLSAGIGEPHKGHTGRASRRATHRACRRASLWAAIASYHSGLSRRHPRWEHSFEQYRWFHARRSNCLPQKSHSIMTRRAVARASFAMRRCSSSRSAFRLAYAWWLHPSLQYFAGMRSGGIGFWQFSQGGGSDRKAFKATVRASRSARGGLRFRGPLHSAEQYLALQCRPSRAPTV